MNKTKKIATQTHTYKNDLFVLHKKHSSRKKEKENKPPSSIFFKLS